METDNIIKQAGKHYQKQEYKTAITLLERYIQNETDAEAYNLLGMIYFNLNEHAQSVIYIKKAIDLEPQNITFLNNLAISYLDTDIEKSQNYFEKSLSIDPKSISTNKTLGHLYLKENKIKEAMACYEMIIKEDKIDFEVATNYAKLLYDISEYSKSIQFINQALNIDNKSSMIHLNAAETFFQMDMPNEATNHYKEFLSLSNQKMDSFIFSKIQKLWSDYAQKYYPHDKIKESTYINAYQTQINKSVKDKIVIEYGHNGGLFAVMAVKAGAKKVYICESDQYIAGQINEVIKVNGYQDIIEVIDKNLYQIDNIKADIAIIDRFGTYVIDENILKDIQYINSYLLKEDALLIPEKCSIYGMCIKSDIFDTIDCGVDMRAFSMFDKSFISENINNIKFDQTSKSFKIFDIDLSDPKELEQKIIEPNFLKNNTNGVLCWYELIFCEDNKVETYSKDSNFYKQLLWNIDLSEQNSIEVIYQSNQIYIGNV